MKLDIYRDQALEKILIVERQTNIKQLRGLNPEFLNGLAQPDQIDSDFDSLPTWLRVEDVIQAIQKDGCFAATLTTTLKEIEI